MITDNYRRITAINGVGAGATATIQLPLSTRIKDLFLVYKSNASQATMEADILSVKLNINGQPRRTPSAAQIFIREFHEGRAVTAGFIPVRFRNPSASEAEAKDLNWEDKTALNTFRLASATIEVAIAAGATAPTLECYANYDGIDDKNDFLAVWDSISFQNQGAGTKTKTDLIRAGILSRIDFFGTTNIPTALKLRADDRELFDTYPAIMNRYGADYGYAPQSNHLAFLMTHTRRPAEGLLLDNVARLEVEYTTTASGDITAIVERIVKIS
jgi:hypothetical protein